MSEPAAPPRRLSHLVLYLALAFGIPVLIVATYVLAPGFYAWINGGPADFGPLLARTKHELGLDFLPDSSLPLWLAMTAVRPVFLSGLLYAAAPVIAAIVTAWRTGALGGIRAYGARWRLAQGIPAAEALGWYAIAFATLVGMNIVTGLLTGTATPLSHYLQPIFPLLLIGGMFLDQGGTLEEGGWRGFAMPWLQARNSPLTAALVLSVIWTLWHVPRDVVSWGALNGTYILRGLVPFFILTVGLTIIIAFFVNRVGGSVWMGVMIHCLSNNTAEIGFYRALDAAVGSDRLTWFIYTRALVAVAVALAIVAIAGRALGRRESVA